MEQKNRRISTRQLVSMAMLGAISIVLVAVIHFPLIPAAAFLEYDPADIPILICAFAYGPLAGLVQTAAMVLMNMIFTPLFMGAPLETVLALMIPAIIPFNVLKAGINGVITFFLYKSISHLMKGN